MFSAKRIRRALATLALGVALIGFAQVVPGEAKAQRPSLGLLQAQINQLNAELNQLQGELDALQPGALRVFDANGNDLGLSIGAVGRDTFRYMVLLADSGILIELSEVGTLLANSRPLFFEEEGCPATETPFVTSPGGTIGALFQNGTEPDVRYFIPNAEPDRSITERSELRTTGVCLSESTPSSRTVVSVTEVNLTDLGLTFPLPTPLFVGLLPQ